MEEQFSEQELEKQLHAISDQFSDDELAQIKRYGQALGGSPTPFDEEVEKHLRNIEANKKKMKPPRLADGSSAA